PAEQPGEDATADELLIEARLVVFAPLHAAVDAEDVEQNDEVEEADKDQEDLGHAGANDPTNVAELSGFAHHSFHDSAHGKAEGEGDEQHLGGVTKRKEEAHAHRSTPLLEKLARRIVDG